MCVCVCVCDATTLIAPCVPPLLQEAEEKRKREEVGGVGAGWRRVSVHVEMRTSECSTQTLVTVTILTCQPPSSPSSLNRQAEAEAERQRRVSDRDFG